MNKNQEKTNINPPFVSMIQSGLTCEWIYKKGIKDL